MSIALALIIPGHPGTASTQNAPDTAENDRLWADIASELSELNEESDATAADLAQRDAQIALFAPPCPETEAEMRERRLMPFASETDLAVGSEYTANSLEVMVDEMDRLIELCADDEVCIAREDAVNYCLMPLR